MNIVNLYENYNNYFDADLKAIFKKYSKIAAENNYKIYLVGGIVRDLLLGIKNLDIDITVEGDAIELARLLEKAGLVKISSVHEDFGTVKVETCGGSSCQNIDFASTRSEIYKKAGNLPTVREIGCSLEKDVLRRDFTVNSLALSLNEGEEKFADLVDYVAGFDDLKSKKIRILHEKSFIDDPTRIIRGLKYATRLGFGLESETFELQKAYLENVNYDMCYKRVKNELKLTLGLNSDECFHKFVDQRIYKLISDVDLQSRLGFLTQQRYGGVGPCENSIEFLIKKYQPGQSWLIYLGIILIDSAIEMLSQKADLLELTKKEKNILMNAKKLLDVKQMDSDFEIYKAFDGMDVETLLIFTILKNEKIGEEKVFRYLDFLKEIKLTVTGKDLLELGLQPSKKFAEAFDYVLKKKLDNPQLSQIEEKKLLLEYIKSIEV
jgi:tRNA nucleotidyltransferase/poly(A) polymerase